MHRKTKSQKRRPRRTSFRQNNLLLLSQFHSSMTRHGEQQPPCAYARSHAAARSQILGFSDPW